MHKLTSSLGILHRAAIGRSLFGPATLCRNVYKMTPITGHEHEDILTANNDTERNRIATEKMSSLTKEQLKKLEAIRLEYEYALANKALVPQQMPEYGWLMLLSMKNFEQRQNYLSYLRLRESNRMKHTNLNTNHSSTNDLHSSSDIDFGETDQEMLEYDDGQDQKADENRSVYAFVRTGVRKMHWAHKQFVAMQFGLPLIFDFSFETTMSPSDMQSMLLQLARAYSFNRKLAHPFNLVCCALPSDSVQFKLLERVLQTKASSLPFEIHPGSYLNTFDQRRVVYLSPHARTPMLRFDSNCVYVLGATSTRIGDDQVSNVKARADGVRCECLPLDRYGEWTASRKSLPLDSVVRVLATVAQLSNESLNDAQVDDAWRQAFSQHVPELLLAKPVSKSPFRARRSGQLDVLEISVFESIVRTGTRFNYNWRYEELLEQAHLNLKRRR